MLGMQSYFKRAVYYATQAFGTTSLTTSYTALTPAVALATDVRTFSVVNTSATAVIVAYGATGSEVICGVAPGACTSPTIIPIQLGMNDQLSIKSSSGTISSGNIYIVGLTDL